MGEANEIDTSRRETRRINGDMNIARSVVVVGSPLTGAGVHVNVDVSVLCAPEREPGVPFKRVRVGGRAGERKVVTHAAAQQLIVSSV